MMASDRPPRTTLPPTPETYRRWARELHRQADKLAAVADAESPQDKRLRTATLHRIAHLMRDWCARNRGSAS